MNRLQALVALTFSLLSTQPLHAQQALDPARMHPVTGPVRHAGTFDWTTKSWVDPSSAAPARRGGRQVVRVYENTCTWSGGGFFYSVEHCEDLVDTGRIPATDTPPSSLPGNPQGLVGVRDEQLINSFQFSYCTGAPRGEVAVQVGFYDNLRGPCAGNVPVSGKPLGLTLEEQASEFGDRTAYFDFGPASDWALPGGSTGAVSCWTVDVTFQNNNGFCLQSEGDGSWDNDPELDHFSWSFGHDLPSSIYGATGVIIAGDPSVGAYGAGSYNIPYGSDPVFGAPCGTGFGNEDGDNWWLNVEGSAPGVFNTALGGGASCPNQAGSGTNCYWFGGWPGGPLGSFWMVLDSVGSCSGCDGAAVVYCTAGSSQVGCSPLLSARGTSSASADAGFLLEATGAPVGTEALFLLGSSGRARQAWGGGPGVLCVTPPLQRTSPTRLAGGSIEARGSACEGSLLVDLNAHWAGRLEVAPEAGARVQAQLWYRDGLAHRGGFSNAVEWTVCP